MTTNTTPLPDLIASALADAVRITNRHGEMILIYVDPNCGGYAWSYDEGECINSGPIGYDAGSYGQREWDVDSDESQQAEIDLYDANMRAVADALRSAGYEVAR